VALPDQLRSGAPHRSPESSRGRYERLADVAAQQGRSECRLVGHRRQGGVRQLSTEAV